MSLTLYDFVDLGEDDAFQISGAMTLAAWVMLDGSNTNNGRVIAKRVRQFFLASRFRPR